MAGGGKGSTPAAPDFSQAALQTAMMGREGMREQTYANRPTVNTPWGSTTWDVTPGTGNPYGSAAGSGPSGGAEGAVGNVAQGAGGPFASAVGGVAGAPGAGQASTGAAGGAGGYGFTPEQWTMNVNLSPEQQAIFDTQQQIQGQRGDLAQTLLGSASSVLGQQADWGSLPGVPTAEGVNQRGFDAAYNQATSRLDPQWNQRQDQMRTQLYNQGLREGDAAFDQQMQNFGRDRNDAYGSALNQATLTGANLGNQMFTQGMQGHQQSVADMLGQRSGTLNELQALLSGQQVGMPQSPGFNAAGVAQAPNMLGAAQAQYGAGLDAYNAGQAGMQGMLGGAAALAPFMFSDARLKEDIRYLDAEALPGVRWATWRWKAGGHGRGVIAQDVQKVRPDLVRRDEATGFLMVNMDAIGGAP